MISSSVQSFKRFPFVPVVEQNLTTFDFFMHGVWRATNFFGDLGW